MPKDRHYSTQAPGVEDLVREQEKYARLTTNHNDRAIALAKYKQQYIDAIKSGVPQGALHPPSSGMDLKAANERLNYHLGNGGSTAPGTGPLDKVVQPPPANPAPKSTGNSIADNLLGIKPSQPHGATPTTPAELKAGATRRSATGGAETLMDSQSGPRWVASVANPPPVSGPLSRATARNDIAYADKDSPQIQALLAANARSNPDNVAKQKAADAIAANAGKEGEGMTPYGKVAVVSQSTLDANSDANRLLTKKAPGAGRSGSALSLTPPAPVPDSPALAAGKALRSVVKAPGNAADAVDAFGNKVVSGIYNTAQQLKAGLTGEKAPLPVAYEGGHTVRNALNTEVSGLKAAAAALTPAAKAVAHNIFGTPVAPSATTPPARAIMGNPGTGQPPAVPAPLPAQAANIPVASAQSDDEEVKRRRLASKQPAAGPLSSL